MPVADLQLPDGRVATVEIPDGMTEEALQAEAATLWESGAFAAEEQEPIQSQHESPTPEGSRFGDFYRSLKGNVLGGLEVGASVASAALAEPAAGISGLVHAAIPGDPTGPEAISAVRQSAQYIPRTERGQGMLRSTAEALAPVAEAIEGAEDFLGDEVFEKTGSPTLAAAAKSFPTLVAEVAGVALGSKAIRGTRSAKRNAKLSRQVDNLIQDAAPSREDLRAISSGLYREVDEMGAVLDPNKFRRLAYEVAADAKKSGLDADVTPAANKVVQRLFKDAESGQLMEFSELSSLRELAGGVAGNFSDPHQAKIGAMIVDKIDDFMGSSGIIASDLSRTVGPEVGAKLKVARNLWGRMRRSELLEEAMYKASNQASGLENGIRTQFRAILNNPKKRRMFNADELKEIQKVVQGTTKANTMKLLGKFGFSEGQATNMLGGTLSGGIGAYVGGSIAGPGGAVAGSIATSGGGTLARKSAQNITMGNARMADALVRAGKDARKVAKAYLETTDNASPSGLAELLVAVDADVTDVRGLDEFTKKALQIAAQRRADAIAATSVSAVERGARENK